MLYSDSLYGKLPIPEWEEKPLLELSDEQLLQKAIEENKNFCISPAVYAMITKRHLDFTLQQMINKNVGVQHNTLSLISHLPTPTYRCVPCKIKINE